MHLQSPSTIIKCFTILNISLGLNDTFPCFKTDSKRQNLDGF